MSKQRLIQKSQLKVTPQQIQFLNLLQTPLVSIDRIIEKELENNPALEEDYEIENEDEKKVFFSSRSSNPEFSTINIEEKKSSLKDYLELQLSTLDVSEEVKFLISYLINSLNEHGFLSENPYAISSDLLINNELDVSVDKIKQAITYLQQFDPCGIGAYDLQDCLLIQLKNCLLYTSDAADE